MSDRLVTLEAELTTALKERAQFRRMLVNQSGELDSLRLEADALKAKLTEAHKQLDASEVRVTCHILGDRVLLYNYTT